VGTFNSFLAIFRVRKERVETLSAFVANKVIGGHVLILIESGNNVDAEEKSESLSVTILMSARSQLQRRNHGKGLSGGDAGGK
jgi:hypothetical protein